MKTRLAVMVICAMVWAVSAGAATGAGHDAGSSCAGSTIPDQPGSILLAQGKPLSGSVLEQACRAYADQGMKDSQQWEQRRCREKLNIAPQLFTTEYKSHYTRCMSSVGTSIESDNATRQDYLRRCGAGSTSDRPTAVPPPSTSTPTAKPPTPPPATGTTPGTRTPGADIGKPGAWEITLLDLKTLKTYRYAYSLTFRGNNFEGVYLDPGNNKSSFSGFISPDGSRIEYRQQDNDYQANFAGRKTGTGRFEGAVCDSRGNLFTFTLRKK